MKLSELDYDLPSELIAQEPLKDRSASRMLVLSKNTGQIEHRLFADLPSLLSSNDLVVLNDSRVDARRLYGRRPSGAVIEVLLLKEVGGFVFDALLKPSKRLRSGDVIVFTDSLRGTMMDEPGGFVRRIQLDGTDIQAQIRRVGEIPLPPYIQTRLEDEDRYQTVYAAGGGSSAAPTAGLHFTASIFEELAAKRISTARVSLAVSIDTFRPVQVDDTANHVMHGELCEVSAETASAVNQCQGKVVAVGTTTARTLESFVGEPGKITSGSKNTQIFIEPGHNWQVVDALLTNFHLPRTTMLAMIASLAGQALVQEAYAQAVQHRYRFLSFGDCMLIL